MAAKRVHFAANLASYHIISPLDRTERGSSSHAANRGNSSLAELQRATAEQLALRAAEDAQREQVKANVAKWRVEDAAKELQKEAASEKAAMEQIQQKQQKRLDDMEKEFKNKRIMELLSGDADENDHFDITDASLRKMRIWYEKLTSDVLLIMAQTSCWRYKMQRQGGGEHFCHQCSLDALLAYYNNNCDLVDALIALGALEKDNSKVRYKHELAMATADAAAAVAAKAITAATATVVAAKAAAAAEAATAEAAAAAEAATAEAAAAAEATTVTVVPKRRLPLPLRGRLQLKQPDSLSSLTR